MVTAIKHFPDYPAGHRQPTHDGHCRFVHGHNYDFEIEFAASHRDDNGFVVDFGKLEELKLMLRRQFDHTLLISATDPFLSTFEDMNLAQLCDLRVMKNTSAEAIAEWVFEMTSNLLRSEHGNRVWVGSVRVYEDKKNSALYRRS